MNKEKKNSKIAYIIIIAALIIAIIAVSFSIFTYARKGNFNNTIQTGTLIMDINTTADLSLVSKYPTGDNSLDGYNPWSFSVQNTGTKNSKYKLYIYDDDSKYISDGCSNSKMPWSKLKYQLKKNGTVVEQKALPNDGVLYQTILNASSTDNYQLKVYISSTAGNEVQNLHFHGKLKLKAILEDKTNFDTGA